MRPLLLLLLFILALPGIVSGQKQSTESLKYLGEKRPGTTPVKFAPRVVSLTGRSEFGSVFSRNGHDFYYAVDTAGRAEIRFVRLSNGRWTKSQRLVFDNTFSFNDPMLAPDETKLFFISDRPLAGTGEKKDYDIWYIEKTANGWSKPINAGAAINSDKNEYYMSFSKDGTMYYSSNRDPRNEWNYNILSAVPAGQHKFQNATSLSDSVNTPYYDADVFIAGDQSYLIFCGDHPDGLGRGDLYISFKKQNGAWTKAKNMGKTINTEGHELCPFVTADGKYLFYTSNQDIYWVDAKVIDKLR
jgi:hypothetical protein